MSGGRLGFVAVGIIVVFVPALSRADGPGVSIAAPRTVLISESTAGTEANAPSAAAAMSADGRYVAFASDATDLVPGGPDAAGLYVRDRDADADGILDESGQTASVLVSVASSGGPGHPDTYLSAPSISASGRFVAFEADAPDLVEGTPTGSFTPHQVFVHDRDADNDDVFDEPGAISTVLASVSSAVCLPTASPPRIR